VETFTLRASIARLTYLKAEIENADCTELRDGFGERYDTECYAMLDPPMTTTDALSVGIEVFESTTFAVAEMFANANLERCY
jgi:hypothetical protein